MLIVPLNLHTIWEFFKFILLLETSPLDWFLIIYQTIFWPFAINSIFHPPMAIGQLSMGEEWENCHPPVYKAGKNLHNGEFFFPFAPKNSTVPLFRYNNLHKLFVIFKHKIYYTIFFGCWKMSSLPPAPFSIIQPKCSK